MSSENRNGSPRHATNGALTADMVSELDRVIIRRIVNHAKGKYDAAESAYVFQIPANQVTRYEEFAKDCCKDEASGVHHLTDSKARWLHIGETDMDNFKQINRRFTTSTGKGAHL